MISPCDRVPQTASDLTRYYYHQCAQIGSGAYGIVVSAEDTSTGKRVAIKKVPNAFQYVPVHWPPVVVHTHNLTTVFAVISLTLSGSCVRLN